MAHISEDRVLETAVGVATSAFTLAGAVTGFRTFASQMANNDTCWYAAWAVDANGTPSGQFENGLGTLTAATTLTRTTVLESSNANTAVTFTGTLYVAISLLASKTAYFDNTHAMMIPAAPSEPPTPVGGIELYAREIVPGNTVLKTMRPSGVDSPIQDGLAFNRVVKVVGSNNAVTTFGAANLTFAGTAAAVTPSGGSAKNQIQRVAYSSAATANAVTTHIAANAGASPVFRGTAAGEGGFRYVCRFSIQAVAALGNFFVGLADTVTAAAATSPNPLTSTTPGKVGLAFTTNAGNLTFVHNVTGTAPTQVALGANFPVNITDLYELVLFVRPHNGTTAGDISYRVRRYTTSSAAPAFEATGTITTNVPAAATLLHPWGYYGNGGTAAAVTWHFSYLTIESDF